MFSVILNIRHLADGQDPASLSNRLRTRRFQRFEALTASLPSPIRILDVGGTNEFWKNRGWTGRRDAQIVTLNIAREEQEYANIQPLKGDATDLGQFEDKSFDVVFSNSVIEHLFTLERQKQMASEVERVGRAFWVQTPNYWFPMEPHFHVPGWQWLPINLRTFILQRRTCGWRGPCPDRVEAQRLVEEVRLLTKNELRSAFPNAILLPEHFGGFIKSWVAIKGFSSKAMAEAREL